jgi:hypothetical protein
MERSSSFFKRLIDGQRRSFCLGSSVGWASFAAILQARLDQREAELLNNTWTECRIIPGSSRGAPTKQNQAVR